MTRPLLLLLALTITAGSGCRRPQTPDRSPAHAEADAALDTIAAVERANRADDVAAADTSRSRALDLEADLRRTLAEFKRAREALDADILRLRLYYRALPPDSLALAVDSACAARGC